MKSKTLGLLCLGIFAVALALSLTSAAITFNSVPEISPYENSFDLTITSNQAEDVTINIDPITEDGQTITFNSATASMDGVNSTTINITYSVGSFDFEFGKTYSTTLRVTDSNATEYNSVLKFQTIDFCEECENEGELKLDIEDINVVEGFGEDEDFWYLFDEIEVELNIENEGDWDIENIEIEWALYSTSGKKIMDDTLSDFDLKDGDDETISFSFILDENIDEFEDEDVVLYVKAKGEIDDNDSPYDEEETCDSDSVEVEVVGDDDFVIPYNLKINGIDLGEGFILEESAISCGQEVVINAELWNIGNDDQEDVYVIFYDQELGINEKIEVGDIDAFENEEITFRFTLPEKLEEGWHRIDLRIYDEDNDLFENDEEDESIFTIRFEVAGECYLTLPPSINAELISEAKENSELTIKVYVQNNDEESAIYTLNAAGYAEWASLTEISESSFELGPGLTKEVTFTFQTNKDSFGDRFFNLEVLSEGQILATQPIVISIEEGKAADFKEFFEKNWKLLGIGLLNLILIIAIIIVAVRTYRR